MGFSLRSGLEPLAIFFGLVVVLNIVGAVRRLANPLIQRSISEPVVFQARIWVRLLRGSWFGITIFDRWKIAVKTTTFQMTNDPRASRGRSRRKVYNATDATMWTERLDNRDCIVLSHISPTRQRETRWAFSADSENEAAWNALSAAGVRAVPAPVEAP